VRIHHIGYVVRNAEKYRMSLPGLRLLKSVVDPIQNADISLYEVGTGTLIELIQPLSSDAFTWDHLVRSGEGLHHICYEGVKPDELDVILRQHRLFKIRGPIHATVFDRDVVFAATRQRAIVEFLL
jgi:catechol 2,3-dioxygenase-like lactoylglutathione lyase family enzyme